MGALIANKETKQSWIFVAKIWLELENSELIYIRIIIITP